MKTYIARFLTPNGTTQRLIQAADKCAARASATLIAITEGSTVSSVRTYFANTTGTCNP